MRIGWSALRSLGLVAGIAFLPAGCGVEDEEGERADVPITRAAVEKLLQDAYYDQAQQAAETLLAQALEMSGEETLEAADAMQLLAEARRRGSKTHAPETLELAERALEIKQRRLGGEHVDVAECVYQLGMLHHKRGEQAQAKELLQRAWAIREARLGPDDPAVANSLMTCGGLLLTDTTDEALELLDRARVIQDARLEPTHPDIAQRMMFQAYIHHTRGELDLSLRLFQDAFSILEQTLRPEHPRLATVHRSLGLVAHGACDYAGARPHYERALEILEANYGEKSHRVAELLQCLAAVDVALGNAHVARGRYRRALEILRDEHGDLHLSVAKCSLDLGYLMREQGDLGGTQEHYERALRFVDTGQAPEDFVVKVRIHYGAYLHLSGDLEGAEEQYERVRSMRSPEGGESSRYLSWALYNLGLMAYQRCEFDQAYDLIQQAIEGLGSSPAESTAPQYAHALIGLAKADHATGRRQEALEHALLAECVSREHMRANSAGLERMLAITFASIRTTGLDLALSILLAEAEPTAASRSAVAREIIRSRGLIFEEMALRHRTMTTATSPALASRAAVLRESISELSNLVVRGAGNETPETYQQMVEAALRKKERAESDFALARGEKAHVRELPDSVLRDIAAALPDGTALVSYYRFRRGNVTGAGQGRSLGMADRLTDSYAALVMSQASPDPIVLALGSAEEIDGMIFRWRRFTAQGAAPVASMRRAGDSLRRRIWDPVAVHLEGAREVLVVPDQALHLVNLASLPTGDDCYLLETGPLLHYLSAEHDLLDRRTERKRGAGLLIMGGMAFDALGPEHADQETGDAQRRPVRAAAESGRERIPELARQFENLRFKPLSGTAREAADIASLWNATCGDQQMEQDALLLLGRDASEGGFKKLAPGRRVLHLAIHGFFLDSEDRSSGGPQRTPGEPVENPERENWSRSQLPLPDGFPLLCCGLALSGASRRSDARPGSEDGILTAEEIIMLDLSGVELAVLSACESGLGQVQAGEGVFGLRRAFELAGVEKVIMSLWEVDDKVAESWMKLFYRSWRARHSTIPEAVRLASLTLLEERREKQESTHPHFWAAFVALGN